MIVELGNYVGQLKSVNNVFRDRYPEREMGYPKSTPTKGRLFFRILQKYLDAPQAMNMQAMSS